MAWRWKQNEFVVVTFEFEGLWYNFEGLYFLGKTYCKFLAYIRISSHVRTYNITFYNEHVKFVSLKSSTFYTSDGYRQQQDWWQKRYIEGRWTWSGSNKIKPTAPFPLPHPSSSLPLSVSAPHQFLVPGGLFFPSLVQMEWCCLAGVQRSCQFAAGWQGSARRWGYLCGAGGRGWGLSLIHIWRCRRWP